MLIYVLWGAYSSVRDTARFYQNEELQFFADNAVHSIYQGHVKVTFCYQQLQAHMVMYNNKIEKNIVIRSIF